jgi:hypothetical protein
MDHSYVSENNVADMYLSGRLLPEESASFEAHAEHCQACLDLMNEIMIVREALLRSGSPAALREVAFRPRGLAAWLARFEPVPQAGILAAALFLLICLPVTFLLTEVIHLHREIDQEKLARSMSGADASKAPGSSDHSGHYPGTRDADQSPAGEAQNRNELLKNPRIGGERTERVGSVSVSLAPQPNTPVFVLASLRSVSPEPTNQANIIALPHDATLFVLSLELEGSKQYTSYSVDLFGQGTMRLWGARHLKPDRNDVLSIVFSQSYLKNGDYRLVLRGSGPDGVHVAIGEYRFTLKRSR